MNIKTFALLGGALLLAGCPGDDPTITDTPTPTGDTDTDTDPVTPDPIVWTVTLTDGDQVDDAINGDGDGDTIETSTEHVLDNYPDITELDFGIAQTEVGPTNGWFGEDCDGVDSGTQGDRCHTFTPDTTMTLTGVRMISQITPGSTTLIAVDYPEDTTPGLTYVLLGVDANESDVICLRMGHQPSYYNGAGCEDYVDPMM